MERTPGMRYRRSCCVRINFPFLAIRNISSNRTEGHYVYYGGSRSRIPSKVPARSLRIHLTQK